MDSVETAPSTPPGYLFNTPVVFSVTMVTPHDLSWEVELVSVCCSKDFIPAFRPIGGLSAVGNVFSGLTDEGNVPTGLDSG